MSELTHKEKLAGKKKRGKAKDSLCPMTEKARLAKNATEIAKKNGTFKKSNLGGRPATVTPETVAKLKQGFSIGFTDRECCIYCDISTDAFYRFLKKNPELRILFDELKEKPVLKAKLTIANALNQEQTAKWYLERKRRDEFGETKKLEVQTTNKFEEMSAADKASYLIENSEK